MKFKNKMMVICLVLFVLISISAVSAADDNAESIKTISNDNISLTANDYDNDEILSADEGSFGDLETRIKGGSSNIVLDKDYTYSSSDTMTDGILIEKDNLTIDGKGHVIDAKGKTGIFEITGATVVLKNIKFFNGFSSSGGAICAHGENLRVYNCTFINNTASSWGGAIYSFPYTYTAFVNSTFIDNNAGDGGALVFLGDKTYVTRHDVLNCTFIGNKATASDGSGGAIYYYVDTWYSNNYIRGSTFINNTAKKGGAVSNEVNAMIDISESVFLSNSANQIDSFAYHVYADRSWFGNTYDNKSSKPLDDDSRVELKNWLYLDVIPDISNSVATVSINNIYDSQTEETSVYSTSKLPSVNVDISAVGIDLDVNKIALDNSGKYVLNLKLIGDCAITATCEGSTITKRIKAGSFKELESLINDAADGSILNLEKDYVYIAGVDSKNGIVISNKHNLVINGNGHMVNGLNKASIFYVDKLSNHVTFNDITIANGYSESNAGSGLFTVADYTTIANTTFINHVSDATSSGAAVYGNARYCSITDSKFINNTHRHTSGGAVSWQGEDLTIENTLFENNTATSPASAATGGAVYLYDGGIILNSTFRYNTADYSGAIFAYGQVNIDNCTFVGNLALDNDVLRGGGAIYTLNATITNSVFAENSAIYGGALFIGSPSTVIDKCLFVNNTANTGIINSPVKGGKVSNSIFMNNNLKLYGANVISCSEFGLQADYNWYGNSWKNYDNDKNMMPVSNLADMSKWLFLNYTSPIYNKDTKELQTQLTFLLYDSQTKRIIDFDVDDLPAIDISLSGENITLNKNNVKPGETISGTLTFHKGNLIAQYGDIKYILPFNFKEDSKIIVNSTIYVCIDEKKSMRFSIEPFEYSYLPFLNQAGRIKYKSNDTEIVTVDASGMITGIKEGIAEVSIAFDGTTVIGDDLYYPSSATVIINVTKITTQIRFTFDLPDYLDITDPNPTQVFVDIKDYKDRPVRDNVVCEFINNNPDLVKVTTQNSQYALFKGIKEGKANVTIKFLGNDKYAPTTYDLIIDVVRGDPGLVVRNNNITIDRDTFYFVGVYYNQAIRSYDLQFISNDTDVAIMEYDNGKFVVRGLNGGIANITVLFPGNDKYRPAEDYVVVYVDDGETHIDVIDSLDLYVTDNYSIQPILRDKFNKHIGGLFEFSCNNNSVVTVDEYGSLTAVGIGQANITVYYAGTSKYMPSTANITVTVTTATNNINVDSNVEVKVDQFVNLNATLDYPGTLIYTSNDTSVVTVNSRGNIQALKVGVANITITYEGTKKYEPSRVNVIVKVVRVPTHIDVGKSFAWEMKEIDNLNATINPTFAGSLTYTSNNESVVKVDSNGKITPVAIGNTTIFINFAGNEKYAPTNETVEVIIFSGAIPTSIDVNDTIDVYTGDEINIGAVLNPENAGKLTYKSSDERVVTIDNDGNIIAVGEGSATITVDFAETNRFLPSSKEVLVTVTTIKTSIDADESITVNVTESDNFNYTFSNPEAGKLDFIIDDTSIAILENGKIKGIKVGNTTLTIKFAGTKKYSASNATINIFVTDVETNIEANDTIKIFIGESGTIVANLNPEEAGKLRFTTADTDIISLYGTGYVYGRKIGNATVTISFNGNGKYRAVTKNVTVEVTYIETSIDVADSIKVNITDFKQIDAKLNPEDAGKLTFTVGDSSIIAIDGKNRIEGLKLGNTTITISFNGNGKYAPVNKTVSVEVVDVETSIELNVTDLVLNYGDTTTIKADIKPDAVQPLIFKSSNPDIVTVDEDGNVIAMKPGVADITVSFNGGGKYRATNKTIKVTVERAPISIEIQDHLDLEIGMGILLKPTTTPVKLNLTYTSSDENTVEVDENGMIFAATSGTAVVTVNFAGNEYYLPSSASVTVDIDKRDTMVKVENDVSIGYSESMNLGAKLVSKNTDVSLTGKLHYVSSDEDVVSVDENGRITANKIGNATITITYDGEKSNKPCNATVNVEVTTKTTSIKLSESSKSLKVDDTYAIVASLVGGPEDYMLIYATEDSNIVRVNPFTGEVTAIGDGTAKITVKYAGDNEYHSSEAEFTVSVSRYVTHITASNTYDMVVYDTIDLHAMVVENEELPLSYSSSEEDVVIVNTKGEATALKSGDAVITISFAGNSKYQPSQKQVIVNVARIPTSINVDDKIELYSGDEYALTDILTPGDAPTRLLSFESDNWDIFDVDSNGVITAGYEGVAELFISYVGNGVYMPSNKTVIVTVVKKVISENDYNFTVEVDHDAGEATITATLPEDAEGMFQVIINGEAYAEPIVDGKAVITVDELTPGDYSATLRYTGDEKYASINNATKFRIGKYKIDKNKDQAIYVDGTLKYSVHLTLDTQAIEGKTIKFKVNGKTYYAKTDVQGYATIKAKLPAKIKTYTVTAQFGSIKVSNKVKVHVIVAKNLNYKKSSKHTLKVTLKKLNKKYLSNKKVTLKFNGKTYTAKTNKKGVASFALKKSVFSKLKVGKTYKYTVKYSTDTVTKTIKIFK